MAESVTARVSGSLQLLINSILIADASQSQTDITLTGRDYIRRSQIIGSSAEALDVGEIGTAGWLFAYNTGKNGVGGAVSDSINIRMGSGGADVVTIAAGEFAMFRLASNTPYAIASSTNSPELRYLILEA